jgi:undecaprenyl-diphosphatase
MPLLAAAVILGLIQGLGEFLPISSSGHLVLAQALLGLAGPEVAFDVALHLGTLTAVFIFYRKTLAALFLELRFLPGALLRPARLKNLYQTRPDFRFGLLIIIGTLPVALIGLFFKDVLEKSFDSTGGVGVALIITGTVLRLAGRRGRNGREAGLMTIGDALLIGLAQALAIAPGLSRSGFTICAGLFLGLSRLTAARYSFLLSVPAILGAVILEARGGLESSFTAPQFAAGVAVAAVSGYLALALLIRLLKKDDFSVFSWWCWAVGLLALASAALL